ncbi:MAG: chromosome segregation protein SMC [Chloracidobacterium sp.]|nr:chromosome segregation protein SMC [Chloracidobacterium sp.]MCO5333694.1 chromosome segregation protein SMC [Pyrinomonadaceae bacterium]
MFKLSRLEITGFKSFADHTEIVFTGSGITGVVGPNGCGKSNVADAIAWVLGEQRAKSLRGGEMKDVVFAGTRDRKPGGMAEVVLHMVLDDTVEFSDESDLENIDEALSGIDESAVDMDLIEAIEPERDEALDAVAVSPFGDAADIAVESVKAAQVGSAQIIETKVKTKRRWRPRSFALDFAPGEAVSVTRRLYLSGESEYLLNGKTCRLRDISDLFAGTGLSGSHYAIIEQGRIGQILSSKPADRRNLIEEAAGISKFRTRQRAAETRLDNARSNLGRVTDIISEVDKQVNSLRRQAAKTRRFKVLQEEFRVLLRQLYAEEGRYYSTLSEQMKAEAEKASHLEAELHTELSASEAAARDATAAARAAEEGLSELRRIHADNALERDRAEREHLYKSEQVVNLNARIDTLKSEIAASGGRLEMLEGELIRLREDDEKEAAAFAEAETELGAAEAAYAERSLALGDVEKQIETERADLLQHTAALERFGEIGRQLSINLERLTQRSSGLEGEARRADESFSENERQAAELAKTVAAEEQKLSELNREREELLAVTASSLDELRRKERRLGELTDEYSAKRHRLTTLSELEEKRAVYTPQVQKIFAKQSSIGIELGGVLADRLNVSETAERAVESAFGEYLQSVVVGSVADAKKLSAWLSENGIGRTAMLIIPKAAVSDGIVNRGGNTIRDHLGVDGEVAAALAEVFPREMSARLVDDLDSAPKGELVIDRDGNMLIAGRMFVGGGKRAAGGPNESLLAFKRELNGLEREVGKLAQDIETARTAVDNARLVLTENEGRMVDLQSLIIKVDRGVHGLQIQHHSAREEIERAERHRRVVGEEARQTAAEIAEVRVLLEDAQGNKAAAETARIESTERLARIGTQLASVRSTVEEAAFVLNDKRLAAATSGERRRSAQNALRRVENESKELRSRHTALGVELSEAEQKVRDLHTSIAVITDRIAGAGAEVERESSALAAAMNSLAEQRANADAMSEALAEINRRLGEARNERAAVEIHQAEAVTELKNIAENCQQELNTALSELIAGSEPIEDFDLEAARSSAHSLRERLENFGAINMLALEELGEAEERFIFLETQRTDIVDSIAATEAALREIKERSRARFRDAFEAINANFTEFFHELFGGGQGQMTLLDAEDVLDAGIEVVAQPPGKRLQNILLLSGGEKAMTAIALVMAIFKYRPSPFCLLDEVDAPLDDANVGRFAAKIADMSEKTQFIVITHNKRTMEAAKALYGVTMQEPGVSKIVSVKFE